MSEKKPSKVKYTLPSGETVEGIIKSDESGRVLEYLKGGETFWLPNPSVNVVGSSDDEGDTAALEAQVTKLEAAGVDAAAKLQAEKDKVKALETDKAADAVKLKALEAQVTKLEAAGKK